MTNLKNKINRQFKILCTNFLWRRKLFDAGRRVVIERPKYLNNPASIALDDYSIIFSDSILADLDKSNKKYPKIKIGKYCSFFYRFQCNSALSVTIGDYVAAAANVFITDSDHVVELNGKPVTRNAQYISKPVIIGNNCWLGQNAVVLKGVTIGDNCIIGANCVVTKDVPQNSVVAGNPGKVIRRIESPDSSR